MSALCQQVREQDHRFAGYKSNAKALAAAKAALLDSIRLLREMKTRPLSEVYRFIESSEAKMRKIDLAALAEEAPVTASRFVEITAEPEMEVRPAPGSRDRATERFFRQ